MPVSSIDYEHFQTNLELCARNNDGVLWNDVVATLLKKYKKGVYDSNRAVSFIERNLVLPIAKREIEQGLTMNEMFPLAMREDVAASIEHTLHLDFINGAYK